MNRSTDTPRPGAEGHIESEALNLALVRLGDAVARLHGETAWIIDSLTEIMLAMRPVSKDGLTEEQKLLLIELDAFTSDELAETTRQVDRGELQLGAAEVFLSHLYSTLSLAEIAGYLDWEEAAVRATVAGGRLYAVEISGRLRFPSWQLSVSHEDKLLPGLTELIEVATARWDWQSLTAFMSATQSSLVTAGRQTPAEFLRRGGDVNKVRTIIESSDWR